MEKVQEEQSVTMVPSELHIVIAGCVVDCGTEENARQALQLLAWLHEHQEALHRAGYPELYSNASCE